MSCINLRNLNVVRIKARSEPMVFDSMYVEQSVIFPGSKLAKVKVDESSSQAALLISKLPEKEDQQPEIMLKPGL